MPRKKKKKVGTRHQTPQNLTIKPKQLNTKIVGIVSMNQGDSPKIEARTIGSVALRDREAWKER